MPGDACSESALGSDGGKPSANTSKTPSARSAPSATTTQPSVNMPVAVCVRERSTGTFVEVSSRKYRPSSSWFSAPSTNLVTPTRPISDCSGVSSQ